MRIRLLVIVLIFGAFAFIVETKASARRIILPPSRNANTPTPTSTPIPTTVASGYCANTGGCPLSDLTSMYKVKPIIECGPGKARFYWYDCGSQVGNFTNYHVYGWEGYLYVFSPGDSDGGNGTRIDIGAQTGAVSGEGCYETTCYSPWYYWDRNKNATVWVWLNIYRIDGQCSNEPWNSGNYSYVVCPAMSTPTPGIGRKPKPTIRFLPPR